MATTIKGKVIKRKRPAEFNADNIDSTAPIKKILDELQIKHHQAFMFYSNTIRQRRSQVGRNISYHYCVTGHPLLAFPDDWDGDLNSGYFEQFPYKCLMPKIITKLVNIDRTDPLTDLMKVKSDWENSCQTYKRSIQTSKYAAKCVDLNEEVIECPKHFVDLAEHFEKDPDPYFDSTYNWYYAGNGNLQLICLDWVDYLLHSQFRTIYLTQFSKDDITLNSQHTIHYEYTDNILETVFSASHNIIAVRTKLNVVILKITIENGDLHFIKLKELESVLPFTGISFDNFHKNILYVTSLDNKLQILNLDRMKCRTVHLNTNDESLVNNWNVVIGSERGFYTHITKNCVNFYDKRINETFCSFEQVRSIVDDYTCNDISVASHQGGSKSLYFGTDHHLFLIDTRKGKKPVQRWTHGMKCAPTYMKICNFEYNKELVCMNSQYCEDLCLVVNYILSLNESGISGVTMPYHPPSIFNVLKNARDNFLCSDFYNPVENRLCTSITGNVVYEQGDNYVILTQNSLGDVMSHTVYPEHMDVFLEDNSVEHLEGWSKDYQVEKKIFQVSSIIDISEFWKELKRVPKNNKLGRFSKQKSKFNEKEIHEAFENEELDIGLLDIWQDEDATRNNTADESSILRLHYSSDEEQIKE